MVCRVTTRCGLIALAPFTAELAAWSKPPPHATAEEQRLAALSDATVARFSSNMLRPIDDGLARLPVHDYHRGQGLTQDLVHRGSNHVDERKLLQLDGDCVRCTVRRRREVERRFRARLGRMEHREQLRVNARPDRGRHCTWHVDQGVVWVVTRVVHGGVRRSIMHEMERRVDALERAKCSDSDTFARRNVLRYPDRHLEDEIKVRRHAPEAVIRQDQHVSQLAGA